MNVMFDFTGILNDWDDTDIDSAFKNRIEEITLKNFIPNSQNRFFAEGEGLLIVGYFNDISVNRIISIVRITTLIVT